MFPEFPAPTTCLLQGPKHLGALMTNQEGRETPLTLEETMARLQMGLRLSHYHPAEWKIELEDRRHRHSMGVW